LSVLKSLRRVTMRLLKLLSFAKAQLSLENTQPVTKIIRYIAQVIIHSSLSPASISGILLSLTTYSLFAYDGQTHQENNSASWVKTIFIDSVVLKFS